jgi:uncharacterized protein (TIGR02246 family)
MNYYMRRMGLIIAILCFPFNAIAGPKEEGQAVFDKFLSEFTANNVDGVFSLFSDDALFWGTASRDLIASPAGIQQYFATAFATPPSKGAKASTLGPASVTVISDNVIAVSGMWKLENAIDGKPLMVELRVSMTLVKRGDRWLIASFHNSRRAPPA